MHRGAFRPLEFDRIVAAVRSFALTPTGAARLEGLRPETDAARVEAAQDATTETVRYLDRHPLFPLRAPETLEDILALLNVEGRALEPLQLAALASFLDSVSQAASAIRRAGETFPTLASVAARAASFAPELEAIRRSIGESGDVLDGASPALAGIRDSLRKKRARLRDSLDGLLRGRDTTKYLQDHVVSERNGRFVVLVRAEHRGAIPGIVHGTSASGATLYVEPLATVETNNEIVALEEQEREEVLRILLALTDRFRARAADVEASTEAATELDVLQAKARIARLMDAVRPVFSRDGGIQLRGARHPLLMRGVVRRYSEDVAALPDAPVPVHILLTPPDTALLITGPNTGGKTVALKTAGLLALMAQAGLHVPAEPGSSLPIFTGVFADIGDEQSIAASLSTFSWHIRNIADIERELRAPALVLLDELGAGTDPVEGGALGIGMVQQFRSRGALVIGTTHYDALRSFASTTPGVVCAAFGFEPDGFRPTFRLQYGTPGRSLALEIAGRLGLSEQILAEARRHVGDREAQLQDHLARVDEDLRRLEQERAAVDRDRRAVAALQADLRAREGALAEREAQFRHRVTDRIEERVRQARREIDAVVEDLKKRSSVLAERITHQGTGARLNTGQTGAARLQARAALDEVAERLRRGLDEPETEAAAVSRPATIGDRVSVGGLGLEGIVLSVSGRQAEVDVRGKRMRAKLADLRVTAPTNGRPREAEVATVRVNVNVGPREHAASEINVIGCRVDEALDRTGRFLDETLITDQRTVRVVHGHGTGQLRRAIAGFLKEHPLVASFHLAPPEQGGGGATVVELKE
jgi:DNA mismatch repair protein MutS2